MFKRRSTYNLRALSKTMRGNQNTWEGVNENSICAVNIASRIKRMFTNCKRRLSSLRPFGLMYDWIIQREANEWDPFYQIAKLLNEQISTNSNRCFQVPGFASKGAQSDTMCFLHQSVSRPHYWTMWPRSLKAKRYRNSSNCMRPSRCWQLTWTWLCLSGKQTCVKHMIFLKQIEP